MMQHNQDHQSKCTLGWQSVWQPDDEPATHTKQQQALEKEAAEEVKQQESKGTDKRAKLQTSEDVDNHIKWDPAQDMAEFTMCHQDWFGGLREVPSNMFDHNSLAFHWVWVFKHQGTVVWDCENNHNDQVF